MRKALIVMSHKLYDEQISDLKNAWMCENVIYPPDEIQELISHVPPNLESLRIYLEPVVKWIEKGTEAGDLVIVQGEYGMTFLIVQLSHSLDLDPVYATTERCVENRVLEDGTTEIVRTFEHVLFRRYGV